MRLEPPQPPRAAPLPPASPEQPIRTERRREGWREFRHAYPGILATMTFALVAFLAFDGWLIYKRVKYNNEVERLRSGMTEFERRQADLILAQDENRLQVMIELIKRQAQGDKDLNLAVSVDSGFMYLQREGAKLREMPTVTGPERTVGTAPDTVRMAVPRGTRTIERIIGAGDSWDVPEWVFVDRGLPAPASRTAKGALGPAAIVLNGGTVIYSMPEDGPLADSTYVMPGSIRASASDMRAVAPNLKPGMKVYFY